MAKNNKPMDKDDIVFINMEVTQLPEFPVDRNMNIIKWGKKNDFPTDIIKLSSTHPIHSAILKGKARYLAGLSIKSEQDVPIVQDFLKYANRTESWYDLSRKCYPDKTLYGGFALIVTTNIAGQPLSFHHVDIGKLRISECMTGVWYSEEWSKKTLQIEKTWYPFYKEGFAGSSVYLYKDHSASVNKIEDAYPKPEYTSVLLDISTDVEISKYFNSLVKNGFSAGHIITFFGGELKPEVKADIKRRFQEQHQGPDNAGKVVLAFVSKDGKGAEIVNVDSNNLDKQYKELNDRNRQNIISGHGYPHVLAKIQTEGKLSDRSEIDLAQELLLSEYVKPEQLPFLSVVKKFCKIKTGVDTNFSTEQFSLLGLDYFNPNVQKYLTNDEVRTALGLEVVAKGVPSQAESTNNALNSLSPLVATKVLEAMSEEEIRSLIGLNPKDSVIDEMGNVITPIKESANEHIKNLSAYQQGRLFATAKKFKDGKITKEQALIIIKGFGINESDAMPFMGLSAQQLSVKLSGLSKEEVFLSWVKQNTIEIDEQDELISTDYVNFGNRDEVIRFELTKQLEVRLKDDEDLRRDEPSLKDFLKDLITRKPKGRNEKLPPTDDGFENVVYTVYKYGLRPELAAKGEPILLDTSHDFCIKMVAATEGKKRLTFEKIDSLQNDFGDNAFDFRGGFWGKKNTCRHIWLAETRIKRVKK